MEPGGRLLHGDDGDVLGQVAVEMVHHLPRSEAVGELHAGHLAQGVDPGVGAPRPVELHRGLGQPGQDGLHLALDGVGGVALALPAVIPAAVVLESELVVHAGRLPEKAALSVPGFGREKQAAPGQFLAGGFELGGSGLQVHFGAIAVGALAVSRSTVYQAALELWSPRFSYTWMVTVPSSLVWAAAVRPSVSPPGFWAL